MHITFYGAVREVTGSMHLLSTDQDRICWIAGMYQGGARKPIKKTGVMPFDPGLITNMYCPTPYRPFGRIPLLTKNGFNGRIYCTRATADACAYLLPDSAHIQESDADYLNYKTVRSALSQMRPGEDGKTSKQDLKEIKQLLKKNKHGLDREVIGDYIRRFHLSAVEPLYTSLDAENALEAFEGNSLPRAGDHRQGHHPDPFRGRPYPWLGRCHHSIRQGRHGAHRLLFRGYRPLRQAHSA